MPVVDGLYQTYIPLPSESGSNKNREQVALLSPVPICVVTNASQLPTKFLNPSSERQLLVGFDCEGVNHGKHGTICILQLALLDAIYIVDIIRGGEELMKACKPALESPYVTKIIHDCKQDSIIFSVWGQAT
ncbi:hypothetical protein Dimus_027635 [Dionaea muscipula]